MDSKNENELFELTPEMRELLKDIENIKSCFDIYGEIVDKTVVTE